jgi:hypothetical protein
MLVGHLQHRARTAQPCVVDEHVDAAELPHRPGHQRIDRCLVGDVAGGGPHPVAVRLRELVAELREPARMPVADRNNSALLQAAPCCRRADAGSGRCGNDDDLARQQVVPGRASRRLARQQVVPGRASRRRARRPGRRLACRGDHGLTSRGNPAARSAMMSS